MDEPIKWVKVGSPPFSLICSWFAGDILLTKDMLFQ